MKKLLALLLATLFVIPMGLTASANNDNLQFNQNGKFTIVHLTDVQDSYPLNNTTRQFIKEMLADIQPDLVVLGGDNTVASDSEAEPNAKENAVKELCQLFVDAKTKFTLVFGNHDRQQGYTNDELLVMYQRYGGEYCLAYDQVPELTNCGTHCLPIYSSDGSKLAFNLFMFDSGENEYDAEGNDIGYDAVHTDQIEWYKGIAAEAKAANGGKPVPAMAFQHIIVQEVYDELFTETSFSVGGIGLDVDGKHYIYLPKVANIKEGYLFERACPGYYNYGQLDAMAQCGDMLAIFSGHDHVNDFTCTINGIDVINSAGCTFHSYGNDLNRGCRVIELDEKDTSTYNTYTYTVCEAALKDGSEICNQGDVTAFGCQMTLIGGKLLDVLMALVKAMFFWYK